MEERFETFTVLINRISRNIRKIKNHEMAEYHLRSAHVSCLYYLYSSPGLTATELSGRCEEDKATVSRALVYLKENGYLADDEQQLNRYRAPLVLTEKGKEVGAKIAEKIDRVLSGLNDSLSEDERLAFYCNLAAISARLDAVVDTYDE